MLQGTSYQLKHAGKLLGVLFSPVELSLFLGQSYPGLQDDLEPDLPFSVLVQRVVEALDRRGLLDGEFFDKLLEVRRGRHREIEQVRSLQRSLHEPPPLPRSDGPGHSGAGPSLVHGSVSAWNAWRRTVRADLSHKRLANLDLSGIDLAGARLHQTRLQGCALVGADLSHARLSGAWLQSSDGRWALLVGAGLRGARMRGAKWSYANLRRADLTGATLHDAALTGADLRGCSLRGMSWKTIDDATDAIVDVSTYRRSGWTPRELEVAMERGVRVVERSWFPIDAQSVIPEDLAPPPDAWTFGRLLCSLFDRPSAIASWLRSLSLPAAPELRRALVRLERSDPVEDRQGDQADPTHAENMRAKVLSAMPAAFRIAELGVLDEDAWVDSLAVTVGGHEELIAEVYEDVRSSSPSAP